MSSIILLEEKKYPKGVALLRQVGNCVYQDGKVIARSNLPIRNKVDSHTFRTSVAEMMGNAGYQVIWEGLQ